MYKIEAMYEQLGVDAKVLQGSTSLCAALYTLPLFNPCS